MNRDELVAGIEAKLRGLRTCDTQATAVAWMSGAYKLMEECLRHLSDMPPQRVETVTVVQDRIITRERLVLVPERPSLQVVQNIPAEVVQRRHPGWPGKAPTVVYPEVFLHPGLKPAPKAWTHADTVRLERAVKAKAPVVQRRGR